MGDNSGALLDIPHTERLETSTIDPSVERKEGIALAARPLAAAEYLSLEEVMTKMVLRLLRILPLALLLAGVASAQTTGTIIGVVTDASTGKAVAGALVVATSPNLQGEQTAVTDNAGNFRLVLLPPGDYKLAVQLEGFKPFERTDIRMSVDKTIRANLSVVPEAVQLEEQVVRTGVPAVDVASAESGAVVSQEFMASVPVGRGYEAIAVVAPTAKVDYYGVSFAGAQSPENQYIIDGMNTTDPVYGMRNASVAGPASLRSNFMQELDLKTGGYGAEYGRATGGIMNVVLKSGSNEFGGSVFTTYTPSYLFEPTGEVSGSTGEAVAYRQKPDEGQYTADFGFEVGGPIMKDKLWFYAGFAPVISRFTYERYLRSNVLGTDPGGCPAGYTPDGDIGPGGQCIDANGNYLQNRIAGSETIETTGRDTYQYVGKLTYLINENNNLTLSAVGALGYRMQPNSGFVAGVFSTSQASRVIETDDPMGSVFAKYAGKFMDKRLIGEVQAGWYSTSQTPRDQGNLLDVDAVEWTPSAAEALPITDFETAAACAGADFDETRARCPTTGYVTGGRGGANEFETNRYVGKASLAYLFDAGGSHNVKGGIDLERVDYEVTQRTTGGSYWRYRSSLAGVSTTPVFQAFRGYGYITNPTINPANGAKGTDNENFVVIGPGTNKSQTDSFAYFLQDVWQIPLEKLGNLTLNYGLRLETQSMENLTFDSPGFEINDNWSPRVAAIWDFTGTGRGKVAANWGRYYYAMPLDMGNRAFGGEIQINYSVDPASCGFTYGTTPAGSFDTTAIGYDAGCSVIPRGNPGAFRQTGGGLTPADSELQGAFVDQFGAEVQYEVVPDVAVGLSYIGRRQGMVIEDMSSNDGADYFIGNPGVDRNIYYPDGSLAGNSKYVETVDPQTGRTITAEFPSPERSYDAVTLSVTKNFSRNWLAMASYTYSSLRGNYPGPFRPETNQLDPGITSEYDLASLLANRTGYLPGDQPHQLKLYAAYNWPLSQRFNVTASGAYTGLSGIPVNALGSHPDYGPSEAFVIPRGQAGRSPFTNTVDLGAGLEYVIRAPYAVNFRVDVFNVLNGQEITAVDENWTFDSVAAINNVNCETDSMGDIGGMIAACPELASLRTVDGRPATVNANWGKASTQVTQPYQDQLSVRFSLALTF